MTMATIPPLALGHGHGGHGHTAFGARQGNLDERQRRYAAGFPTSTAAPPRRQLHEPKNPAAEPALYEPRTKVARAVTPQTESKRPGFKGAAQLRQEKTTARTTTGKSGVHPTSTSKRVAEPVKSANSNRIGTKPADPTTAVGGGSSASSATKPAKSSLVGRAHAIYRKEKPARNSEGGGLISDLLHDPTAFKVSTGQISSPSTRIVYYTNGRKEKDTTTAWSPSATNRNAKPSGDAAGAPSSAPVAGGGTMSSFSSMGNGGTPMLSDSDIQG